MCTQIYGNGELSRKIYKFYATYRVYKNLFAIVSFVISNIIFFTCIYQTHPHNLRHKHYNEIRIHMRKKEERKCLQYVFSVAKKNYYLCMLYIFEKDIQIGVLIRKYCFYFE